jgi:hypothetical protein
LHDLIPLGPALPGALTTAEIDATMAYAEAEKALATRQAYASVPAHVGIVASYLSGLADSSRKASTIGRRAAAIGYHHKMAGHEPPTNHEGVKATLRGIRRTIGTARAGKAPATADLIGQMLAICSDTMIGKRDRALLCSTDACGSRCRDPGHCGLCQYRQGVLHRHGRRGDRIHHSSSRATYAGAAAAGPTHNTPGLSEHRGSQVGHIAGAGASGRQWPVWECYPRHAGSAVGPHRSCPRRDVDLSFGVLRGRAVSVS